MENRKKRNISDILLYDETIFRDMNVFDPDYIPENYKYRDSQMEALAVSIRPGLHGARPINTVILGSCATGKTTAVKKLFEMVENSSEKVICSYINCQLHTTRFGIFSQIHKKIFGHLPPETGVPFSRIYQKIMKHLVKENKALVIALDDVNYLFQNKNANKIFYDILRSYEEFPGSRTGLFAVVSDVEFRYALDKNVNTIFIPQEVVFKPYSYSEIENILKERVKIGFFPGVISDDIVEEIAMHTSERGDLRVGIDLLRVCGNLAESEASAEITEEHLTEALNKSNLFVLKNTLDSLSENEKIIVKAIVDNDEETLTAGVLFDSLDKEYKISYSSFNRAIEKLEFLRVIDTKLTGKGVRGNSRVIIPRFPVEDIKKCL